MNPIGSSSGNVRLDDVLITARLAERPSKPPDFQTENQTLLDLADQISEDPENIWRRLSTVALSLCNAGTAGISLLERTPEDQEVFRWVALVGSYEPYAGGTTPRDFSPCGTCLDRGAPQLYWYPGSYFTYLNRGHVPIVEGLVVPIPSATGKIGTIWVVSHTEDTHFTSEHVRILTSLAHFTAAAWKISSAASNNARFYCNALDEIAERNRKEELHELEVNAPSSQLLDANRALAAQTEELTKIRIELERFVHIASHDFKEPLRTMTSFSGLLAKRYTGKLGADGDEFIKYIVDGAGQMQALLEKFLGYCRSGNNGKKRLERADCNSVLRTILYDMNPEIQQQDAHVTYDLLPVIVADPIELGQVFENLIGNAVKFHGAASLRVHISAKRQGDFWIFSVRDNGIGIEPEYLERIFGFSKRLHPHDQYPGAGVGLAICKKIVEAYGGRIWAESAVGRGSTFYFALPDAPVSLLLDEAT
jgi:signal transduction histidine kinase